ncbi:MAG: alpha/beta hydrolase [Xenococcus sp. MO_188.B8]|nr:alpha/beta hydrolase [Xenococcus sp. MO_188.B8]
MMISEDKQVFVKTVVDGTTDNPIMLFIHGYPDDESVWERQIAYFKDRFCCVRVVLPNFSGKVDRKWGFDFPEIVALLKTALDKLNPEEKPVLLVTHDWGAFYGYLFEKQYPHLVRKIISLDIGGSVGEQSNFLGYFMIPLYQLNLALAFIFSQIGGIGVMLGKVWTKLTFILLGFLGNLYTPKECILSGASRQTPFNPFQNYPYFYAWKQILLKGRSQLSGEGFRPLCPVLYVYGCQGIKGFMSFHDRQWLEYIEQHPPSKAVAFEKAGHWLMQDSPNELNKLIDTFLG